MVDMEDHAFNLRGIIVTSLQRENITKLGVYLQFEKGVHGDACVDAHLFVVL